MVAPNFEAEITNQIEDNSMTATTDYDDIPELITQEEVEQQQDSHQRPEDDDDETIQILRYLQSRPLISLSSIRLIFDELEQNIRQ